MSNCSSCQKKFVFLKTLKLKCAECEQYYCGNCIRKSSGFKAYCETCLILNKRPVNKRSLMDLRSREVKSYLNKRKISTDNCIEKEELINRFLRYVAVEPALQKNGNKKLDFFNGILNSLTNSMPNIFESSAQRAMLGASGRQFTSTNYSSFNPPNRDQDVRANDPSNPRPTSSRGTSRIPDVGPSSSRQNSRVPSSSWEEIPNDGASSSTRPTAPPDVSRVTEPGPSSNHLEQNITSNEAGPRKLMKLSDLNSIDEIINLNVKNLKELLFMNRVDFRGCVEKEELTNKVVQLWLDSQIEDPTKLPSDELCKVCMDAPLNSVLLECGHIATCINCGKQLAECPICRQYIVRVVHTFKA